MRNIKLHNGVDIMAAAKEITKKKGRRRKARTEGMSSDVSLSQHIKR